MSASNPSCHEKGCQCATCTVKCNICCVLSKCTNDECSSKTGKRNCKDYQYTDKRGEY